MEIERKFLVNNVPHTLQQYATQEICQSYISTDPVIRIRKKNDSYILEIKGSGNIAREEYGLPLTASQYESLKLKAEGKEICKTRYLIPIHDGLTAELDIFQGAHQGLITVEVEFDTQQQAIEFMPPAWFGSDVSNDKKYKNSYLSQN